MCDPVYCPCTQVKLPYFFGTYLGPTVEDFIEKVEIVATKNHWSDELATHKVISAFSFSVFNAYRSQFLYTFKYPQLNSVFEFLKNTYSGVCMFSEFELDTIFAE
jgi:hypothetical protein